MNETVIKEYWDDILRLVTTIKLKEISASDIFRRLNSYSKQHKLYQALKSFGQIIKSDFILRYIDDVVGLIALPSLLLNMLFSIPVYTFMRDLARWVYPPEEFE